MVFLLLDPYQYWKSISYSVVFVIVCSPILISGTLFRVSGYREYKSFIKFQVTLGFCLLRSRLSLKYFRLAFLMVTMVSGVFVAFPG